MDAATRPVIGILGAGRLGLVLAQLFTAADFPVRIAGSGPATAIAVRIAAAAPAALPQTAAQVAASADVVILAMPLGRHRDLNADLLAGRLVVDAMNYWLGADGLRSAFADPAVSTSERVAAHFPAARVVKALNHMSHDDLAENARPRGAAGRAALGVAGDAPADVAAVAALVDAIGFDPVAVGALADGIRLEPDTEPFGLVVGSAELREMLDGFWDSQRGRRVRAARRRAGAPRTLDG